MEQRSSLVPHQLLGLSRDKTVTGSPGSPDLSLSSTTTSNPRE
jgi:hypothetical protein